MKHFFLFCAVFFAGFTSVWSAESEIIPIQVTKELKLVYQVSEDREFEGINRGLFYVKKLIDTYEREGIDLEEVDFRVVFHGTGLNALVNDTTRARLDPERSKNPNAEVLASLIKRGVHVELCADTMRQKKVAPENLHNGVRRVVGAYPRLVDLQLQGYAYIKFE